MRFGRTPVIGICLVLCVALASQGAFAGMSGPVSVKKSRPTARQMDVETLKAAFAREGVAGKLRSLGYEPDIVAGQIDKLSDEELRELATDIENVQTGDGAVYSVLLLVMLALFIVWLGYFIVDHRYM